MAGKTGPLHSVWRFGVRMVQGVAVLLLLTFAFCAIAPDRFFETVATLTLDIPLHPAPRFTPDEQLSAINKIALLHNIHRFPPAQQTTITLSDAEMNGYIQYRMERQHRAGKLPAQVREALQHVQIRFIAGGFLVFGNVDLKTVSDYLKTEFDTHLPTAFRMRKTTFEVVGTLQAEQATGQVTITSKSLGRLNDAWVDPTGKAEQIARTFIADTLVEDFLKATVLTGDALKFRLPKGLDSVRLRSGFLDVTLTPK